MKTRGDYLAHRCTHREYYAQFVTDFTKKIILRVFGIERLKKAYLSDPVNLNSIPLIEWDRIIPSMLVNLSDYGDIPTIAGSNCILKEAALQLIEESNE